MCDTLSWLTKPPVWSAKELALLKTNKPIKTTINQIIENSEKFQINLPFDTIKTKTLIKSVPSFQLEFNIQSAYPVIHENILNFYAKYLLFKCEYGSSDEKIIYENMSILDLIERFLLKNDLNIDEIKLCSMLSISSYSYFINNGNRFNGGVLTDTRDNIEDRGVMVAITGPKFEQKNFDFTEIIITNAQNCAINGYGNCALPTIRSLFFNFYEENSLLYNNVRYAAMEDLRHFKELTSGDFFYNCVYVKRLAVCFDTLLMEANYRAGKTGKFAYVHVVGVGLGIRRIEGHQEDLFVKTFGESLKKLGPNVYNISDVNFSHFHRIVHCLEVNDGDMLPIDGHPNGGIFIHISVREPFEKLNDPDKLLIVSYASDANSLPANDFSKGSLYSSASSSQIAELHNPYINETISANNLMVATLNGVLPISEYIQQINNNNINIP